MGDASKLAIKDSDVAALGNCVAFMQKFNTYKNLLADMLAFAASMKVANVADAQKKLDGLKWTFDAKCASGAAPAPAKKDDKKPAAPAKKDDKKPAAPAAAGAWDMKAKIGDTNALDSWNAYINMPQVAVDANAKPAFGPKCMNDSWKQFMNPIIFGKMDMEPRDFADFKAIFEVLKFLNDGLANGTAKAVYQKLLGNTWWAKFKVHMKATGKKISAHMKKAGAHIKATFNKIGKATVKGAKKMKIKAKGG